VEPGCKRTEAEPVGQRTQAEPDRAEGVKGRSAVEGPEVHGAGMTKAEPEGQESPVEP